MRTDLRALRERIRQVEAGGHRDTPLRRAYNRKLRAYRMLRGGGGLTSTVMPVMIAGMRFKKLNAISDHSFTFTFTHEYNEFTVKVLSEKPIHTKDRRQVYVRLFCDGDRSNPDPDHCRIEIRNHTDPSTPQIYEDLNSWLIDGSVELFKRFVVPYVYDRKRKSTEAMIQLPEDGSMREKEKNVWQKLNRIRDENEDKVRPLLTKDNLSVLEIDELSQFLSNLSRDRYEGDKYEEFNRKLIASKRQEKLKNEAKCEPYAKECLNKEDLITSEEIKERDTFVMLDKQCYKLGTKGTDGLEKWVRERESVPHSRRYFTTDDLEACLRRDMEMETLTQLFADLNIKEHVSGGGGGDVRKWR